MGVYESTHLLDVNREQCKKIYKKNDKCPNDIVDYLISLHLVMEISINSMLRRIIFHEKSIYGKDIADFDKIDFITKINMFLLFEDLFNIENLNNGKPSKHKIIGDLKNFSGTRNCLLHGALIGSYGDDDLILSESILMLNIDHLKRQTELFKSIINNLSWYVEKLKNKVDVTGFLNLDFLED